MSINCHAASDADDHSEISLYSSNSISSHHWNVSRFWEAHVWMVRTNSNEDFLVAAFTDSLKSDNSAACGWPDSICKF